MSARAVGPEVPSSRDAVLEFLEVQRSKVMRWRTTKVREVKLEAEKELAALEKVAGSLDQDRGKRRPTAKRTRGKKGGTPAALAAGRRDAIARLLEERAEALAVAEIGRTLNLSEFSTRSAVRRLCEEGRAHRVGTGSSTRYRAGTSGDEPSEAPGAPTDAGRVLEVIRGRVSATLGEIAQATRIAEEEVRRICGGLIVDGEIEMGRRGDRKVYVARGAA